MNQQQLYLENQVKSATPGGLIVILYTHLIRFIEEAQHALENEEESSPVQAANAITRSLDILAELNGSLRPEHSPELSTQLQELYAFFTSELSEGLREKNPQKIGNIIPLIEDLRDTWSQANELISNQVETT